MWCVFQLHSQAEYEFSLICYHLFPLSSVGIWWPVPLWWGQSNWGFLPFFLNTVGEITMKHCKSSPFYQERKKSKILKLSHWLCFKFSSWILSFEEQLSLPSNLCGPCWVCLHNPSLSALQSCFHLGIFWGNTVLCFEIPSHSGFPSWLWC